MRFTCHAGVFGTDAKETGIPVEVICTTPWPTARSDIAVWLASAGMIALSSTVQPYATYRVTCTC
jgi:hypothetical protein